MNRSYPTWSTAWPLCSLLSPDLRHPPLRASLRPGWCTSSPARPCSSGGRSSAPPASCSTPGWRSKRAAPSAGRRSPRTESCERSCRLYPPRCSLSPGQSPERLEDGNIQFHQHAMLLLDLCSLVATDYCKDESINCRPKVCIKSHVRVSRSLSLCSFINIINTFGVSLLHFNFAHGCSRRITESMKSRSVAVMLYRSQKDMIEDVVHQTPSLLMLCTHLLHAITVIS